VRLCTIGFLGVLVWNSLDVISSISDTPAYRKSFAMYFRNSETQILVIINNIYEVGLFLQYIAFVI
jgi:hypothetical protein